MSSSSQTVTTLESGGSRWALPVRPAISQIAARVANEIILSVLAFIPLFTADLLEHIVQRTRFKGLLESYCVFLQQSRFFEKSDACVAAFFAGAAIDVPDSELSVRSCDGVDERRLGFSQKSQRIFFDRRRSLFRRPIRPKDRL